MSYWQMCNYNNNNYVQKFILYTLYNFWFLNPYQICHLVELCLKSTYFSFEKRIYKQTDETAMDSTLFPIIANIFMEDFEQTSISTTHLRPKLWKRYVDDTFIIWPHGGTALQYFLLHINYLHERIELK